MYNSGDVIDNRYEVIEEIGRGAMGVVLRIRDLNEADELALKYCALQEENYIRRFAREVRTMASITHLNVMPVLYQNLEHDPPFFVMPIAEHCILDEIIRGLSEDEAINIFKQICFGIQAIHNANGTHRDIKPGNIMRMFDRRVTVSDLGLVKLDPRDTTILTQTNAFIGTRIYCAPEQLIPGGSRGANARTDVYQLGKTFYELLTGDIPALIDLNMLPVGLRYIVNQATQQHPDQRFQTVASLMDSLENYILSKAPDANPERVFEVTLEETKELLKNGNYQQENLNNLLNQLLVFTDNHELFINQFERIPNQVLSVIARKNSNILLPVLEAYCTALENVINTYNFGYAEIVAKKMQIIFNYSNVVEIKTNAIKATLIASVILHRFAAMDVFDSMLISIKNPSEAAAISEILQENLSYYRVVAERIPRAELNKNLHIAYDMATN